MESIYTILKEGMEIGASDVHLTVGQPPVFRKDGNIQRSDFPIISPKDCQVLVYSLLSDRQKAAFEDTLELDFSAEIRDLGRFRVNVHKQRGHVEAAIRLVSAKVMTLRQLGIPETVENLCRLNSGLILITGPTGSGKTTTMAAMLEQINRERRCVIITIEDPIEFVLKNQRSVVKQREVATDTRSFANALRHILRQDPDVIGVGEMRDLETMATALTAAETGHLVLATIHTPDAAQTIDRIIDVFPPYQQHQIRIQLANSLQAVISQQLLPVVGSEGRVVATELLICTTAVRQIIRTAKLEQLHTVLQTGSEFGMLMMDKSLKTLYQKGIISYDEALSRCKFPDEFESM